MKSWLVVADSRHARIFSIEDTQFTLREIADFTHPRAIQHGDNPTGHVFAAQSGTRHGLEPATLPKEKEVHAFAVELAQHLQHEFSQGHFSQLTLAAEPDFLGELREALPEKLRSAVVASIDKNFLLYTNAELSKSLREHTALH